MKIFLAAAVAAAVHGQVTTNMTQSSIKVQPNSYLELNLISQGKSIESETR